MDYFFRQIIIKILRFYQKFLSPDHGPIRLLPSWGCRFQPTCSEYAINAYTKYNFFKASWKTLWRLMRCQPFNKGGYDPA